MTEAKRPLKVFLCHAHADRDPVRGLYTRLTKDGVDAWLDKEKLLPGQDWELEIRKAVREADVVVVCLSKQFNQAGFRQKEVRLALDTATEKPEGEIFVIPARLEECDNLETLRKWHWVDLFEADGYEMLMRALRTRAEKIGVTLKIKKSRSSKRPDAQEKIEEVSKSLPADTIVSVLYPTAQNESNPTNSHKSNTESPSFQKGVVKKTEVEVRKDKTDKSAKKRFRLKTEYVVAIIGAVATIVAGILGSPLIDKWFSPVAVATESATTIITLTPKAITPSRTPETIQPSKTPTKVFTPTATPDPFDYTDSQGVTMRLVPAGSFIMGSSNIDDLLSECIKIDNTCKRGDFGDEEPSFIINLDTFYIDKYEVTNEEYKSCVDLGVCQPPFYMSSASREKYYGDLKYDTYPVIYVNWDMANAYCSWRGARLPTEAEWEKAARGVDGNKYPWGEDIDCSYANYLGCEGDTTSVTKYSDKGASPFGVYDMAGNVWEWVADNYETTRYYSYKDNMSNPQGPANPVEGYGRVIRGGSWVNDIISARSANRLWGNQNGSWYYVGFRCAKDVP